MHCLAGAPPRSCSLLFPRLPMFNVQAPNSLQPSSTENTASTSDPVPNVIAATPTGGNPALQGLTAYHRRPPESSVTKVNAERGDNVSANKQSAQAILGKIPLPIVAEAAAASAAGGSTVQKPTLDDLPTELIQEMNLDPRQMQFVSHRYAGIFHGEAAALSLASTPARARSLRAVSEAVNQLERVVPENLRHDPLAVLCAQIDVVPQQARMQSFDLLFKATQKCTSKFEPLTELFRQTNDWNSPMREACQARLANIEGADEARAAAGANNVFGHAEIPQFLERMDGFTDIQKSAALGALAKQLFSLPHLGAHDFARICESFHQQPWPPAAASGLLRRIGWISDPARERLTAISQGEPEQTRR
jgi:hypothetical protein